MKDFLILVIACSVGTERGLLQAVFVWVFYFLIMWFVVEDEKKEEKP